ncbi:MAG: hypothetical protein AAFV98_10080 [Chloroflexota bacterium]
MDFLLQPAIYTTLRLAHIVFGLVWVGFGIVAAFVIHPLSQNTGESGNKVLRIFYGYSAYNKIFPIAAIITTLAGIILWGALAEGAGLLGYSDTGNLAMATGAVAGLLAFGHGAGATGRFSAQFAKLARTVEEGEAEAGNAEITEARSKLFLHGNISAILTIIAVVLMASASSLG